MLEHYKSWSSVKKRAEAFICDSLHGRITYFYTNYHDVHNVYGRAAIRFDDKELACFSWVEMCHQERDTSEFRIEDPNLKFNDTFEKLNYIHEKLKPNWDANCTYCESDFIAAVQRFFHLTIEDALSNDDYIIKILAIIDKRTGKRTLRRIRMSGVYLEYPDWVQAFYKLRFDAEVI